jgi:uncharacterized repeat protein (TIGR01451 family)
MTRSGIVGIVVRVSLALALPVWLGVVAVGLAQPAYAATTITVSTCDEAGLDAAVAQANTDNAGDTINFSCSGTIDLTATLDITGSMTIDGTGQQVALDGQGQVGVLSVASGVTLTINSLTVQDGDAQDGAGLANSGGTVNIDDSTFSGSVAGDSGGAVDNYLGGTLTITDSIFSDNRADQQYGGAVNNDSGSTVTVASSLFEANSAVTDEGGGALANGGTMAIASSSFAENDGGNGAAIDNIGGGTMSVVNSSFISNEAYGSEDGGAVYNDTNDIGAVDISFSSFWHNIAVSGEGNTLYIDAGKVTFEGSALGDNPPNCGGGNSPIDDGYNEETGTDCGFTGTGDLQNASFGFTSGPESSSSGPQANFALFLTQGSPGIDAVPLSLCPPTDENGNPRPDDPSETTCDMGAGETDYPPAPVISSSANPIAFGQPLTITAVVPATDGGGTVAFYAPGGTSVPGCTAQPLTLGSDGTYSATCTFTADWVGTYPVSATYSGDAAYPGATTGYLPGGETFDPAVTLSSSPDPSVYGEPVTFTATVAPITDGAGTVAFYADGSATAISGCGAQPLTEVNPNTYTATCTSSSLGVGSHAISASYSGDSNTPGSTGTLAGGQTVNPAATTTSLSSSASPSIYGQPVSFTATVTPTDGGGTVAFYADGSTAPISGCATQSLTQASASTYTATCTTSSLAAGSHAISAAYSGDSAYPASSGTLAGGQTVSPAPLAAQVVGAQTYGGSPAFTITGYSGLVNGDTPAVVTGTLTGCTTSLGPGAGVGTYLGTISGCSGLSSPNYAISYSDAGVTVSPAPLTITASSAAMTYGTTPPAITPAYSGFVNSDGPGSLSTEPACSTTATSSSPVGTYPSTCTGAADPNYAISYVTGTVTVGQAAQSISFTNPPATGVVGKSATLAATGGGSGNLVVFSVDASSGAGVCTVSGSTVNYAAAGSCVIDANQAGNTDYSAAPPVTVTIIVDQAPVFVLDSPPATAVAGQEYGYSFEASGTPAPAYALAAGAPSWLSINASTGELTGTPPAGTTSFSYTVTAANVAGTATAGPFTVTVTKPSPDADISAALACPATMTVGGTGTCTLTVANAGPATASKVAAGILLPAALSELSCTASCARHANVFTWTLASLASGASAKFDLTIKASKTGTALVLAAAVSQNPDPKPLNNISTQQITIKS